MDCCGDTKHEDKENGMKGGNSMKVKKSTLMWVIIGALVIATIFLTFKASSIGTGAVQATASAAKTAASSGAGMVGGC